MRDANNGPVVTLALGILLILDGLRTLITGDPGWVRGFRALYAMAYIFIPIGIILVYVSIKTLIKRKGKPYTPPMPADDELAQIKVNLDRHYRLNEEEREEISRILGTPPPDESTENKL